jgi:hypothetical protein
MSMSLKKRFNSVLNLLLTLEGILVYNSPMNERGEAIE